MFESDPITVVAQTEETITFTVSNTFSDDVLCAIMTHFHSEDEQYTCPISPNVAPGEFAEYTAKCIDGVATVELYVYDPAMQPLTTPTVIADACEAQPESLTTKYTYDIPCGAPDACPSPTPIDCSTNHENSFASDAEGWLFGAHDASGALLVDDSETSKSFYISTEASSITYSFNLIATSTPAEMVYVRVGSYYLDVSESLSATGPTSSYYGTALVVAIPDGDMIKFSVTIPKELFTEGRITLGLKAIDGSYLFDDTKVDLMCMVGTTKAGGGGGDPHFQRWDREHTSFHGECDLVMVHSDNFHNGAGLDLHVRTKIEDYFSYIETAALRVGDTILEFHRDNFFVNGKMYEPKDLPVTFGGDFKYTISNAEVPHGKNMQYYQYFKVDLHEASSILFKYYKKYLTISVSGHSFDFGDSVGLLGEYETGNMISRDGQIMTDYNSYGFEWQVNPGDGTLFQQVRSPQLPYEQCRMPTASRPARRLRGIDQAFYEQAKQACAHIAGSDQDLCTEDIIATGDLGIATLW